MSHSHSNTFLGGICCLQGRTQPLWAPVKSVAVGPLFLDVFFKRQKGAVFSMMIIRALLNVLGALSVLNMLMFFVRAVIKYKVIHQRVECRDFQNKTAGVNDASSSHFFIFYFSLSSSLLPPRRSFLLAPPY